MSRSRKLTTFCRNATCRQRGRGPCRTTFRRFNCCSPAIRRCLRLCSCRSSSVCQPSFSADSSACRLAPPSRFDQSDHYWLRQELAQQFELLSNQFRYQRTPRPWHLPPGRLRLVTMPSLTGSVEVMKTIGIVFVADRAANAAAGENAAITAAQSSSAPCSWCAPSLCLRGLRLDLTFRQSDPTSRTPRDVRLESAKLSKADIGSGSCVAASVFPEMVPRKQFCCVPGVRKLATRLR